MKTFQNDYDIRLFYAVMLMLIWLFPQHAFEIATGALFVRLLIVAIVFIVFTYSGELGTLNFFKAVPGEDHKDVYFYEIPLSGYSFILYMLFVADRILFDFATISTHLMILAIGYVLVAISILGDYEIGQVSDPSD